MSEPFKTDTRRTLVRYVIFDALPISQKRMCRPEDGGSASEEDGGSSDDGEGALEGKDEGKPLAWLYASVPDENGILVGKQVGDSRLLKDVKQPNSALFYILNRRSVPQAWVWRLLRGDVAIANFATGRGWDDDFGRCATTRGSAPGQLHITPQGECVAMARWEPAVADAEFRTKGKAEGGGYKGQAKKGYQLGAYRLIRPTPLGGVVAYVAKAPGGRELGQRESIYNGLRRGRYPGARLTMGPGISQNQEAASAAQVSEQVSSKQASKHTRRQVSETYM